MDPKTKLLTLLSAHPDGMRMPEIIAALGVSQPTAWRRIQALESLVGCVESSVTFSRFSSVISKARRAGNGPVLVKRRNAADDA